MIKFTSFYKLKLIGQAVILVGGVRRRFWVLVVWVYGSILEEAGILLPKGCGLRWGWGQKSIYGMIFGLVINH
jgi:hypothetical protein